MRIRAVIGISAALAAGMCSAATYTWTGGASGSLNTAANWSPAPSGAFTADDELVVSTRTVISLDSATTVGKITLNSDLPVRFGGPETLTATEIANSGAGAATFACPVQFAGAYRVNCTSKAVNFAGGATATLPDEGNPDNAASHALTGEIHFTQDWTLGKIAYPYVVPAGSRLYGKQLAGVSTDATADTNPNGLALVVEEGGYAEFDKVTAMNNFARVSVKGRLKLRDIYQVGVNDGRGNVNSHVGFDGDNSYSGVIEADGVVKYSQGNCYVKVPTLYIGAKGLGAAVKDYTLHLDGCNKTIYATADFEIFGPVNSSNPKDWGLALDSRTIFDTQSHTITWTGGATGGGNLFKAGAGTLVMNPHGSGLTGAVTVSGGTLRIAKNEAIGTGAVTVAAGARLEVAAGVTISNPMQGAGTLYLENGVTLVIDSAKPCYFGEVALAPGASVTVSASDSPVAPAVLLTGVSSSDYARFSVPEGYSFVGGALVMAGSAAATDYVWAGASGADWAESENWRVNGATPASAPSSGDTVRFENASPVTVGGSTALAVTKIVTTSGAKVTFSCPVQFSGTYLVDCLACAPTFQSGATATRPDDSLTEMNIPSHTLSGAVTFTEDWTIPLQPAGRPFILAENSTLSGKVLSASAYNSAQPGLRLDGGSVATFESVAMAGKLAFWLNGGRLVATGDITVGGEASPRDFGYYVAPSVGTVEAHGLYKNVTGYGKINLYVTNIVVGAGGFGMYRKDYSFQLYADVRLTAADDMTIFQPIAEDVPKDSDWGINIDSHTFTIDTAEHAVTFDSHVHASAGAIVKEGEGELIMQGRQKKHTGGTIVAAGTLNVALSGAQGYGPLTVKAGAVLANSVVVSHPYALTLDAGAVLKPAQNVYFDVSDGSLALPANGTVTVDMTDFTFVNGVANPVLGGVAAGDEAKFSALVPTGVVGVFSVSDGFLYYTATAGGSAAADLLWNPVGDATWSVAVAAWLNQQNEQVAFSPYANATVATAGAIALPEDVQANDVKIAADGDVTLNGAGKLGGPGTIVKTGEGTFTFNATGGLDAQPVIVSNGVFKLGEDLSTRALGATADTSPIIVEKGGTLDINYNVADNNYDPARHSITHDKLIKIAGDGVDGNGAIVSTRSPCYIAFSDVELTDDAAIGGTVRSDFRHSTAYGSVRGTTRNTLTGPGKCLTVKNSAMLTLVGTTVDLGSILVPEGYELRIEGVSSYSLPGGIRLAGGRLSFYGAEATHGTAPLMAESGDSTISCSSGTPTFSAPITVAEGATLSHTGGSIVYTSTITGDMKATGGAMIRNSPADTENLKVVGAKGAETVRLRQSGTYTGADIWCHSLGMGDVANTSLDIVFRDSTIDVNNFMVGWGLGTATALASANISIAEGTKVTTPKVAIGDDGTSISNNVKTVLSVDGGTLNLTNNDFFVAYNGPNAEFVVNSGTANVDKAVIKLRANNQSLGGYNKACFVQNGGTFNYGGPGFTARYEDNTEDGQIVFRGGEFNASTNWAIPNWISTCFKDGAEGGWTLNQADGTTNTWNTALVGSGDVTLNGSATLVGNKEVQGVISGKWTIGDGFTAGLEGASSLLGGLAVGEGATATIDIATDRSAVFTARDFSAEPTEATCITSRFNKQFGGTTRGTITHDESLLFTHYDQATRPFGDMNYTATYAVGQFYVEEGAAGEWTFKGKCDDWVLLWIDGESVMASSGRCAEANGTKTLSAGWHSFRHIATDNGGAFGADNGNAYQTIGYKDGSGTMANFARFNVENLRMRPAADMGDPNNPNTIRWSHYKGTSSTVTASTFKNQDFAWDFCCITNNLQYLQWYGSSDTTWFNTYTVNRYEGWFFVTAENAGKEWTFRSNYDDRCALWIDGVDSGLDGNNGSTLTYKVTLSAGWHRFRIQTADFTGNAGPWNGNGLAISYQIDDGSETFFGTDTLAMMVCPDGYVQGEVALASNARLANNVVEGAAEVYGTVKATGTGATMSGPFKFRGAKLAYANVASNARDLTQLLAFENASDDMFAELGGISVDFSAEPTVGTITVAPVYGLDLTDLAENVPVAVTVNGQPYNKKFKATIKGGSIAIVFRSASVLFLR